MSARLFISYRRADSRGFSHAIYNYLVEHFSEPEIFMDVDDIEPGSDFHDILKDAVDACDVMIVLIGPKWINITDAEGNRRLDNPQDFVRIEVSRGLERNIKVIPVLVNGAQPVKAEELPDNLKPLARLNVLFVGDQFNIDMDRLIPVIERELEEAKKRRERGGKEKRQPLSKGTKKLPKWALLGGGLVTIVALIGLVIGLRYWILPPPNDEPTKTPTHTAEVTKTLTITPASTTPTHTTEVTKTPTITQITPTPTLGIGSFRSNPVDGAVMWYVPAGEFGMGRGASFHIISLNDFYINMYEITNRQYAEFLNAKGNQIQGGVTWLDAGSEDVRIHLNGDNWQVDSSYESHPVVEVSWFGAQAYCQWVGGRLPTEAEWEKAARGGLEGKLYPWGDQDPVCSRAFENGANFGSCIGEPVPVGSYRANGYGLYDMAGNVWEWVISCYQDYPYNKDDGREDLEASCSRVMRGGGWFGYTIDLWVSDRYSHDPNESYGYLGFRCVTLP